MPLFAFVSGLVMWPPRDTPLGAGIVSRVGRVRSLLVPYLAWFIVLYFVDRWSPTDRNGVGPALVDAAIGRAGFWYLYAVFICTAVVLILTRKWVPSLQPVGRLEPATWDLALALQAVGIRGGYTLSKVVKFLPMVVELLSF